MERLYDDGHLVALQTEFGVRYVPIPIPYGNGSYVATHSSSRVCNFDVARINAVYHF